MHSPGLNKTMAFMQANSAASTAKDLKCAMTSRRTRMSESMAAALVSGEVGPTSWACSERDSSGHESSGMDHWTAHRTNSSLHASSIRIT